MAKKRNINGIVYVPVIKHKETVCRLCGKPIIDSVIGFSIQDDKSDKMYCTRCMSKLSTQHQIEKQQNATEYPLEDVLYVGIRHGCTKPTFENFVFNYFNGDRKQQLTVKKCPICNQFFLEYSKYEKNMFYLDKYKLIRASTEKEIIKLTCPEYFSPRSEIVKQEIEIPNSVRWFATHPYKGGGCSGK